MSERNIKTSSAGRLPLIELVRAVLATTIAWHHFALYGPLAQEVPASVAASFYWLKNYRWVVQAFFVISGYVLARGMSPRTWKRRQVVAFVARRYCRLGLPYLATIALAIAACFLARGVLSQEVIGPVPTLPQVAAHVAFVQDILGYPSLSAGLWFVCIEFQLGLAFVALLFLRDAFAPVLRWQSGEDATPLLILPGGALATASLFYFNTDSRYDVWAVYYFAHFFLGVLVYYALDRSRRHQALFVMYVVLVLAALAWDWRWRLALALASGGLLFAGGKSGLLERWPQNKVVAWLGLTSYSLFLVHFPVLVLVETWWVRQDWVSPVGAMTGLLTAYAASLAVAELFFRLVEAPAARLSRTFAYRARPALSRGNRI